MRTIPSGDTRIAAGDNANTFNETARCKVKDLIFKEAGFAYAERTEARVQTQIK